MINLVKPEKEPLTRFWGRDYSARRSPCGIETCVIVVKVENAGLFHPNDTIVDLPDINELVEDSSPDPAVKISDHVASRTIKFKFEPVAALVGKQVRWSFSPDGTVKGVLPATHTAYIEREPGFNFNSDTKTSNINTNGTAAVRVNMPPMGFNKGRLRVEMLTLIPTGTTRLAIPNTAHYQSR